MWPNSDFPRPVGSFQHPVPVVGVDPDAAPLVFVSFNERWLPYIVGALKQLVLQSTWATDDPYTWGIEQFRAMNLLSYFARAQPINPAGSHFSGDIDVSNPCEFLRIHDGKLQGLCCFDPTTGTTTWEDIPGQEGGFLPSGATQPGATERPAAGASKCYEVLLQANSQWILPFSVNDGDIITITDVNGAWTDGAINWYCPDGTPFVLGACVGAAGHAGGDPDPTDFHMQAIAVVGSAFYPATSGPFTLPGGTGPQSLILQANDGTLDDNRGSVSLKICVQSGATPPTSKWCYTMPLPLSDFGWQGILSPKDATYVPGDGWDSVVSSPDGTYVQIGYDFGTTVHITDFSVDFTCDNPFVAAFSGFGVGDNFTGSDNLIAFSVPAAGPQTVSQSGLSWSIDKLGLFLQLAPSAGPTFTTAKTTSVTLQGTGTNPFGSSNC